MRVTKLAASLVLGLATLPSLAMAGEHSEKVLTLAVDEVIRPGYHHFEAVSGDLAKAMQALCANPSDDGVKRAETAFDTTLKAWGGIEFLRSGPALEKSRFERILYYPDRKSIGLKQIQAILAKKDETATTAEGLAGKSVGVQGLTALDYVLYGSEHETLATEKNGHRCRYGAAIAENIHVIGGELAAAWDAPDGIAKNWKTPGPQNPVFRTDAEAITELVGTMVHGLEMVREQRIENFFSGSGADQQPNPKLAPFWRSGKTWVLLGANMDGLSDLWKKSHMETLLKDDQRSIASSIGFVLKSISRELPKINPNIETAVTAPDEKAKIDFVLLNTKDAHTRISEVYGAALGIGAGFSFSDGD